MYSMPAMRTGFVPGTVMRHWMNSGDMRVQWWFAWRKCVGSPEMKWNPFRRRVADWGPKRPKVLGCVVGTAAVVVRER